MLTGVIGNFIAARFLYHRAPPGTIDHPYRQAPLGKPNQKSVVHTHRGFDFPVSDSLDRSPRQSAHQIPLGKQSKN